MRPARGSGLVQQTVQIVASHDLTLFVGAKTVRGEDASHLAKAAPSEATANTEAAGVPRRTDGRCETTGHEPSAPCTLPAHLIFSHRYILDWLDSFANPPMHWGGAFHPATAMEVGDIVFCRHLVRRLRGRAAVRSTPQSRTERQATREQPGRQLALTTGN